MELLDNRVLVLPDEVDEKTKGGLFLAETAKDAPQKGVIIECGLGRQTPNGDLVPMRVAKGDRVLFPVRTGVDVLGEDGQKLLLFREGDLLAKIR